MLPGTEGYKPNCKNNRHSELWKNEVNEIGSYEMLALVIIF